MICLDTSPLIWGIQGQASEEHSEKVAQARIMIQDFVDRKVPIMVPAPAFSEFLCDSGSSDMEREIAQRGFYIAPFDIPAAVLAAKLMRKAIEARKSADQDFANINRQMVKVDAMIVAVAISQRAHTIITSEVGAFRKLAGERLIVRSVEAPKPPPHPAKSKWPLGQKSFFEAFGLDEPAE